MPRGSLSTRRPVVFESPCPPVSGPDEDANSKPDTGSARSSLVAAAVAACGRYHPVTRAGKNAGGNEQEKQRQSAGCRSVHPDGTLYQHHRNTSAARELTSGACDPGLASIPAPAVPAGAHRSCCLHVKHVQSSSVRPPCAPCLRVDRDKRRQLTHARH